MPLVSIAIPSYNHDKYISDAINSVLNQTFNDFELIIIDDGSTDNSREIIRNHQREDGRIRTIFHENNQGIAKTINEIISIAQGKYIALLCSDDVWFKNKLEEQIKILDENDDLVIWSEGLIIDSYGKSKEFFFTENENASDKKKSGQILDDLLQCNYIFSSSIIVKRDNIKNIGFDENLTYLNDFKTMLGLAANYEYYFIPEPLACYRLHGKNTILSDEPRWHKDKIIFLNEILSDYESKLTNKSKNIILSNLTKYYFYSGERNKAFNSLKRAFFSYPLNMHNIIYFPIICVTGNSKVRKFIISINKLTRKMQNKYYSLMFNFLCFIFTVLCLIFSELRLSVI